MDMDITKVINKNRINLNLEVANKEEAISSLAELLLRDGVITSKEEFIKDVYLREEEGETGIGGGIAIPHGKSDSVIKTSLAIGRTKEGIQWETLDGEPVRCIILFAVRQVDRTSTHIKLLAQVAGALADDNVIESLLTKENPEDIIDLFRDAV
jgi:PTS system fructose-specific IIA component